MTVLPDVLAPGLKVVFCGTAASTTSAQAGAYYAGPGNRFWEVLFHIGLTPHRLGPQEFRTLLEYGIGLTDLVKTCSGPDNSLSSAAFEVASFLSKIKQFAPKALAFNGKRAAKEFYNRRYVDYGCQLEAIGPTVIFVLPSTAGLARRYWDESHWRRLADFVR